MLLRKSLALMLIAVVLLLGGCTAAPAAPAPATDAGAAAGATAVPAVEGEPVKGGTAVVGTPQEPGTLNPLLILATIEDVVSSFVIEGLVQIDNQAPYIPVLATDLPTVSDDGLTVTYQLKPGVSSSRMAIRLPAPTWCIPGKPFFQSCRRPAHPAIPR